jgi:hypothetical protein
LGELAGRLDLPSNILYISYTMVKEIKNAQVNLRIKPSLKRAAEKAAAEDNRSLTSLIEKLLIDYLKKQRGK